MLRGIKRASSGRIGKAIMTVVLGLLAVSFAIWGIGDIFRGFGLSSVARIGGTEIGIEQFRSLYNDRLQQLGRETGRPITMDQARMIGFDRQVLAQIVADTALDERVRAMGLNVSNQEVAGIIMSDPNFRSAGGFDRARFDAIIRNAGYNESRFVAEQRKLILRRQIVDTIAGDVTVPKAAIEAVNRFRNEERAIEFIVLDRSQAGNVPTPTQEELSKFFEERRGVFRAPEYRKAVLVVLTPADMIRWQGAEVNETEARRIFEQRRERYGTPEQRHVQQIVFPNAEEAKAAADKIAQGASFEDIAKERDLKDSDIDLGTIPKSSIIDQTVAEAAFALKEGEVSAPVQGRFGIALVRVLKIVTGPTRTYEQVADEIKRDMAAEQAKTQVSAIRDKLEDARAGGETLSEAAEKLKLATRTIEAIDRNGTTPEGIRISDLPKANELVPAIFNSEVGVENDPLQFENGYIWYDVTGITPARERTLDEVKNELEIRYTNEEIAKRLREKANAMVEKLKGGTSLKDVAEQERLKLETDESVRRGNPTENLSAQTIDAVFRADKGGFGSAEGSQATQRVVFRVNDIKLPQFDANSAEAKRLADDLRESFANELLAGYSERLNAEVGVSINQSAFNQVVGGGTN